jgi:hypothetical protein
MRRRTRSRSCVVVSERHRRMSDHRNAVRTRSRARASAPVLERAIEDLLTRPRGLPSHAPLVRYRSLQYQAASWDRPRRVIASYNQRGTAEHWIKESKAAPARPARRHPRVVANESPAAALQDRRAADSRAYRATRAAPDAIWSTVQGAGAESSVGGAAAVSLTGTVRVTDREAPGSHRPQASSEGLPSSCREG